MSLKSFIPAFKNINTDADSSSGNILKKAADSITEADAVIIGAGAGLSTAAGFTYSGKRFKKWFADFEEKYNFHDMYSGGFYPYKSLEEYWAFWSRYIYANRYMDAPKKVYSELLDLVKSKDYFVLTTNVDHCFQKAGFDKKRLFYTQGDYGLFQCRKPCCRKTYDNKEIIYKMMFSQGYILNQQEQFDPEINNEIKMEIPTELVPRCPNCGEPMTMNLRSDDLFVQDEGWYKAAERYDMFLRRHKDLKIVYLELGVGYNTPVIIKYPFWQNTLKNPSATYICINKGEAVCPDEIKEQSICIDGDIGEVLKNIKLQF